MKNYSIDIHVHTTLKPCYNNYPGDMRSMWNQFTNACHAVSGGLIGAFEKSVLRGTQTALEQAAAGNVKIIGVSIFTYEYGWTRTHPGKRSLLSCLTGLSMAKLGNIAKEESDIYGDTIAEYEYILKQTQQGYTDALGKNWQVKFLTKEILNKIAAGEIDLDKENTIYLFISIEGIQSLGIKSVQEDYEDRELIDPHRRRIMERINEIKNTWKSIPQHITFCHHFGNQLAGHARTIPPLLAFLGMNQQRFMNAGITTNGKKVIREILGDSMRRINIDIKHFSARARKEYYAYLEVLKQEFPGRTFPILCSHTGFINKYDTLDQLMQLKDSGDEMKHDHLLNWSVNMCKEDLQQIQASGGMIGVQIDIKRLAGKLYKNLIDNASEGALKRVSCEVVWANIFTAIACLNYKQAWDILCIGSDYDGIVSFLPGYPTFAEYPALKKDLVESLTKKSFVLMRDIRANGRLLDNAEIDRLMFGYTPEQLVDKLFSTNALLYLREHFVG